MTPEQIRAGRELLKWSRERLAEEAGVEVKTLLTGETGRTKPRARTLAAIRTALEAAGVEFVEQNGGGPGVRLRSKASSG